MKSLNYKEIKCLIDKTPLFENEIGNKIKILEILDKDHLNKFYLNENNRFLYPTIEICPSLTESVYILIHEVGHCITYHENLRPLEHRAAQIKFNTNKASLTKEDKMIILEEEKRAWNIGGYWISQFDYFLDDAFYDYKEKASNHIKICFCYKQIWGIH